MPKFRYVATDQDGNRVKGRIDAQAPTDARATLADRGLTVVDIQESPGFLKKQIGGKVRPYEIMHLSRELAAFVKAGVPILEGMQVIASESANPKLRSALFDIAENLRRGERLSAAFDAHRKMLPGYFVDMIRAAELTGRLDEVLNDIADYLERDVEARQKIRSALAYPIIILGLSVVVVIVLLTFVIPRFEPFFASLGTNLPLQTRILLSFTRFLSKYWWIIVPSIGAIVVTIVFGSRTAKGRKLKDRVLLRLPVIGQVIRYSILERACRILSAMIKAGVPLPQGLVVMADSTNNVMFQQNLHKVREEVVAGEGLSSPLSRSGLIPKTLVQIVRVGEETGTLDDQLDTAARFFGVELGYKIKRMTNAFEPAVIIAAGLFVGYVAIAVVSAILSLYEDIGTVR